MRAAVITAPGAVEVTTLPDPTPAPGWVVIDVAAVGLCGTDLHVLAGEHGSLPVVPGHEVSGTVVALGEGCVRRSGALASHVTTVEAARDMDVLRAALGESRLTYLGASYGTKLGATYAELFPKKVGRMVLDGAEDVALSTRESALHQAAGFETALRSYVGNCVDQGGCFLGSSVSAGLARISALLESIHAKPLPAALGQAPPE